jgi:hypothetical protein
MYCRFSRGPDAPGGPAGRRAWQRQLSCRVKAVAYDTATRVGVLRMADGDCCDMTGCVALFERIASDVQTIQTYSGDQADTRYRKVGGVWQVTSHLEGDAPGGGHD